jgi:hypothetical protein
MAGIQEQSVIDTLSVLDEFDSRTVRIVKRPDLERMSRSLDCLVKAAFEGEPASSFSLVFLLLFPA